MRTLVWFRNDLRVDDNTALVEGCAAASRGTIALFVIAPDQWKAHDYAAIRVDYILRTLAALSADLAKLNIPLLIETAVATPVHRSAAREVPGAEVPATVLRVAKQHECDALYFNQEHEADESVRDETTLAVFREAGLSATSCSDQCLMPPGHVRTGEGRYFTVFSPFKRAMLRRLIELGGPRVLPAPRRQARLGIEPTPVPAAIRGVSEGPRAQWASLWPAGGSAAMQQLRTFCGTRILSYKQSRDLPAQPGTSRLSPALTVGSLSHRQCVAAALEANPEGTLDQGPEGIMHWISEILWREFYIHILVGFPRVSKGRAFQRATERIRWRAPNADFDAWKLGRTGVPIVDAGMRQLTKEGWMHNRVRMIVAMFLTKNLFIDWRQGERWFMRNLVDGFLASNNGGWQWSASTGTDAAPYFRIFNPVSQSRKVDPEGEYIRAYVPELRTLDPESIHEPWEMPLLRRSVLDYPERPVVDLAESRNAAIEAFRSIKSQ